MNARFNVTYDIVTPESAEHGEAEERGFICEGATLREAFRVVHQTRTNRVSGVESIESDCSAGIPRSVRVINGMEFETGANESRSIHFPPTLSDSSARRLARLLGARS